MPKLHELQERRATIVAEMRAIKRKRKPRSATIPSAEDQRHKELKTELAGLDRKIERARDLQEAERAAPAILHTGEATALSRNVPAILSWSRRSTPGSARMSTPGSSAKSAQEVVRRSGRKFAGIAVPDQYFQIERRTLLVGSSASELYPEQHRGDLFIDRAARAAHRRPARRDCARRPGRRPGYPAADCISDRAMGCGGWRTDRNRRGFR